MEDFKGFTSICVRALGPASWRASEGQKWVRSKWQKTEIGIFGLPELSTITYIKARSGCRKLSNPNIQYRYVLVQIVSCTADVLMTDDIHYSNPKQL